MEKQRGPAAVYAGAGRRRHVGRGQPRYASQWRSEVELRRFSCAQRRFCEVQQV